MRHQLGNHCAAPGVNDGRRRGNRGPDDRRHVAEMKPGQLPGLWTETAMPGKDAGRRRGRLGGGLPLVAVTVAQAVPPG